MPVGISCKLAHGRGLAGTVDADEEDDGRKIGEGVALHRRKLLGKALGEGFPQLRRCLQILLCRFLAQVICDLHGDLCSHVAHDKGVFEALPELLVDLAAHVEELVHGLARAGEAMLQPVKKSHLRHRPPFL